MYNEINECLTKQTSLPQFPPSIILANQLPRTSPTLYIQTSSITRVRCIPTSVLQCKTFLNSPKVHFVGKGVVSIRHLMELQYFFTPYVDSLLTLFI
ncbi:hypothetical protein J7297_01225 [Nakaseomyces glabratus]|nr:hypothetical protein J7297_01225 [Nakaseomyces glabratus]KAH7595952.1 hypothetical protein J7296_01227 [Nakaseomyces glabratus]